MSDRCPSKIKNSQSAELYAVVMAIEHAVNKLDAAGANSIVIKTDCQGVAQWFGWRWCRSIPRRYGNDLNLLDRAYRAAHKHELFLIVTWVRGHQRNNRAGGYLNNQVDTLSRRARTSGHKEFIVQDIVKE